MEGKTFKIVQREFGYQKTSESNLPGLVMLIASLLFFTAGGAILYFRESGFFTQKISWQLGIGFLVLGFVFAVIYMSKDLDFGGSKVKTVHNWNDNSKAAPKPNELKDNPLINIWVYPFMAACLIFFNWLFFFVADSYIGYVVGVLFSVVLFLLIKQGVEKLISYQKYGVSTLVLTQNPIPKGEVVEVIFKNGNVQNDFSKLSCTLQFIEEHIKETQDSDGSKSRSTVFKSWYRETEAFSFGYDGGGILMNLPTDFPGNSFGKEKKYWVLDVEGVNSPRQFKTTFFLPVV